MKILFVTNGYPPQRWAGTETYTAGLAEELVGRGHRVHVTCIGDWDTGKNYWNGVSDDVRNGVSVGRINLNWMKSPDPFRYLYKNPVVERYLDRYLEENQPDLVHVSSCETLSASVLNAVTKHKIPLVLSITDFWFLCPRINLLRNDGENCTGATTPWECLTCLGSDSKFYHLSKMILPDQMVEPVLTKISRVPLITRQRGFRGMFGDMEDRKRFLRYAFSLPDIRLVDSEFVRRVHQQNGFDDPIQLHSYGHDLSWLKDYHGKAHDGSFYVGFIGQIIHSKGVHLLLQAARRFSISDNEEVKFLIYGNLHKNPAYARILEELSQGLNNVEFCGTYPRERSAEVYSRMDVLVVPSLWYDFPLIIHEAFASKTPVIVTNLGGMAEAVSHEVNGLLFERGNVDDLVGQIRRVASEPGLIKKLIAGIPSVKSIQEDVIELEKIYAKLLPQRIKTLA